MILPSIFPWKSIKPIYSQYIPMKPTIKISPMAQPQRRQEARAALAEAEAKACQAEELCQQKQNEAPGDAPGKP